MKAHLKLTAKKMVDFKGTLLQALHQPGQKYALLLYKTENGLRYCLSKNIKQVNSMQIGQPYRVKGKEYTTGHKTFLDIVTVAPVIPMSARIKKRAGLLAGAVSLFVIAGSILAGFMVQQGAPRSKQTDPLDVPAQSRHDQRTPVRSAKVADIINTPPAGITSPSAPTPTTIAAPAPAPVRSAPVAPQRSQPPVETQTTAEVPVPSAPEPALVAEPEPVPSSPEPTTPPPTEPTTPSEPLQAQAVPQESVTE